MKIFDDRQHFKWCSTKGFWGHKFCLLGFGPYCKVPYETLSQPRLAVVIKRK